MTGEANFSMPSTSLTVGGFSQPSVAKSLIEQSGSTDTGFCQRFLWLFPQPTYAKFDTLESADCVFTEKLGKTNKCNHAILYNNFLLIFSQLTFYLSIG